MKKIRKATDLFGAINDYINNQEDERSEDDENDSTLHRSSLRMQG